MKASNQLAKSKKIKHIFLIVGLVISVVVVVCTAVFAYRYYQNSRPGKILSDAIDNSSNIMSSDEQGFRRLIIGYEPVKASTGITVKFDTDGRINAGVYRGKVLISSDIFRDSIELSGDVVGYNDDYYLRLKDTEASIKKAEADNAGFKLYSSYARELATKLDGKWIKISADKADDCNIAQAVDASSSENIDKLKSFVQDKSKNMDLKKLNDETVGGEKSYHLSAEVSGEDIDGLITKACESSGFSNIQTVDIWVSKTNREFKKISATTKSGTYSVETADSKNDESVKNLEIPTDFTTVEEVQKMTEQIIGTVPK